MFSTCIFCNKPLGRNESVEAFPVGERLAFDAAHGRLWVVCRACERWNLTPLDERWEAIEQAEKLYRDTRRRVSTDNIGLAKLRDGTSLVRIGEPQRPEFAAWRYGDQFGRRRKRAMLVSAGGIGALGAVVVGGSVAGVAVGSFGYMLMIMGRRIVYGDPESVVARVQTAQHGIVQVRRRHLAESSIGTADDGTLSLYLRFKKGAEQFSGEEAKRVASIIIPKVNRYGGRAAEVSEAVQRIESAGDSERFLALAGTRSAGLLKSMTEGVTPKKAKSRQQEFNKYGLFSLPAPHRLALEMALHEEAERRALEGELAELERAWREAEEVAAIADDMFMPEGVESAFRKLKGS